MLREEAKKSHSFVAVVGMHLDRSVDRGVIHLYSFSTWLSVGFLSHELLQAGRVNLGSQ